MMTKKSFFMRTYNLNIYLILFSFLTGFFGWSLGFLESTLDLTLPISLDLSQLSSNRKLLRLYGYEFFTRYFVCIRYA